MLIYLLALESPEERSLFESIYRTYRGALFNVAKAFVKNDFDAEDAVHLTFMYVTENMYKFTDGVCPKTMSYLVKTVRSRAVDILRARKRCPPIEFYDSMPDPNPITMELSPLAECMAKLPVRYRDALILRIEYGFEFWEIGKLMNVKEGNARKIVTRARNKLRKICEKEGIL